MHHLERENGDVAHLQRLVGFDGLQVEQWHTRVEVLPEAIRHGGVERRGRPFVGIDIDGAEDAKRPDVVDAGHMVVVYVCEQHGIDALEVEGHDLLPEVGAAVYEHPGGICLYECRRAQPVVAGVVAPAHFATAAHSGNSPRGA